MLNIPGNKLSRDQSEFWLLTDDNSGFDLAGCALIELVIF